MSSAIPLSNGPAKNVGGSEIIPNSYPWLAGLLRCKDYEREQLIIITTKIPWRQKDIKGVVIFTRRGALLL